ncbi:MAG TPA: hypothetical protein VHC86_09230 [Opitutaceae bacterium]|nr:hypothetical protein [Opitutaceae bacterium]
MISKTPLVVISALGLAQAAWAQPLAPKSMQANPTLEMTFVSEQTIEGKAAPQPTPEHPIYYVTDSAGFRQVGDAIPEKTLTEADMAALMAKALAARNFRPADAAHPPTLLIVYTWGSHNRVEHVDWTQIGGASAASGTSPASQTAILKNLLERATLVGGEKFAVDLYHALQQEDDLHRAQAKHPVASVPAGSIGGQVGAGGGGKQPKLSLTPGDNGTVLSDNAVHGMSPVEQFRNIDTTHAALMTQAAGDIYFVVASAYDYQFALKKQSLLLWRTRMTVDATGGVSQEGSLPTLVLAAGPYLGSDMAEATFLRKESLGRVIVGSPQVIGAGPLAAPPAPPAGPQK